MISKPLLILLVLLPSVSLFAQTKIVDYTFENEDARPAPEVGSFISYISTTGGPVLSDYFLWVTGSEAESSTAVFSGSSGEGRSIDIFLDATGYQDITLGSFFQMSATNVLAAKNWQLSYSLDGGITFTQIGSDFPIINDGAGNSEKSRITEAAGFVLPASANNNSKIVFRLNSAPQSLDFEGNPVDGGQIRFDNFSIMATEMSGTGS